MSLPFLHSSHSYSVCMKRANGPLPLKHNFTSTCVKTPCSTLCVRCILVLGGLLGHLHLSSSCPPWQRACELPAATPPPMWAVPWVSLNEQRCSYHLLKVSLWFWKHLLGFKSSLTNFELWDYLHGNLSVAVPLLQGSRNLIHERY